MSKSPEIRIADALEALVSEVALVNENLVRLTKAVEEIPSSVDVNFDVDTYNLVSLGLNRIAEALEEKTNG